MNLRVFLFLGTFLSSVPCLVSAAESGTAAIAAHLQDMVILQGDKFESLKSDPYSRATYTVLYFSAGWCPDCRRFSPALVSSYDRQAPAAKRFEVLLFSKDKTEADLLKYMRSEKMKWPAIAFDKLESASDLKQFAGRGIPWLSVFDQKGNLVLQSKNDQDGADVLKQLEELLKKAS